ncbi:tetratricopeptide repeat protein [Dethiobacter alkaliphilus]|uniref:tetratricopeptide repeat protein n=1 Tax=Dethiobacter alkaliphilus TaxID=427926 RepID=UPI002225BA1D|nr:tetratricopeptide repeat protein [Dethiobacter alkaliphilus]MCW3491150.1 tetratricopeptide repeat protein [Dethiobacter alkaliphilus]
MGFSTLGKNVPLKTALIIIFVLLLFVIGTGLLLSNMLLPDPVVVPRQEDIRLTSAQKIAKQNPDNVEALIQLGYTHLTVKNYEQAVAAYQTAYELAPESPMVQYHLALAYLALEDYAEAIVFLKPLADKGLFNVDAHYALGNAYYVTGDYNEAVESFKKVIVLMPGAADAHYLLALSYESLGDSEQAIKSLNRALTMVPNYQEAQVALNRLSLLANDADTEE